MTDQWKEDKEQFRIFLSVRERHAYILSSLEQLHRKWECLLIFKKDRVDKKQLSEEMAKCNELREKLNLLENISKSQTILMLRELVTKMLKKHKKNHNLRQKPTAASSIKSFKCTICDKTFSRQFSLRTHRRTVHEKIKDFKCNMCNAAFSQQYHLNIHRQAVHENIKNFKCFVCSKAFGRRTDLKRHQEVHNKIKCFKCWCNNVFFNKTDLLNHQKNTIECQK